ncbi:MAG TPA: MarR family transcriptional regulator [Kofleriaceae bacterium]|nr:MarR family transcriptional regulator [Kofleriaceae bacterium]
MQDDRRSDRLRGSLANGVVRLFRLVNRVHNRKFRRTGVSAEQAHILTLLSLEGPLTIGRLQRLLALSSPTLTGAIDRLEALELVRRVPSSEDRRAFVIEPRVTARKLAQLDAVIEEGDGACFAPLTPTERKELLRLLEKCIAHLDGDT